MPLKIHTPHLSFDANARDEGRAQIVIDGVEYEIAWKPKYRRVYREDAAVSFLPVQRCPMCEK